MKTKVLKASILAILLAVSATTVLAEYQILFFTPNDATTPTNPVFDSDNVTKLAGSAGWVGQLYVQVGTGAFSAVGSAVSFLNSSTAGFISGPTITVADSTVTAPTTGAYQLRVWNTANGSTFETASVAPGAKFGTSSSVTVTLQGYNPFTQTPPISFPTANGFASFSVVPEPATIALGLFGAAGLFIRRRK